MAVTRKTWEIIIVVTAVVLDVLKLFKDKFKNGGKKYQTHDILLFIQIWRYWHLEVNHRNSFYANVKLDNF